jgi:hypothetical protein
MTTLLMTPCRIRQAAIFSCGAQPLGVCQYCARSFCTKHGVTLEDGQEICSRKACVAKREDVERHLVYKQRVAQRNREAACGHGACDTSPGSQCSRCRGYFCPAHAFRRDDLVLQNRVRVSRIATLCHHCWARRPIWVRT